MIEIHQFTGCYALDALDQPELVEFEAHLASCCNCGHEIADFYETTAELTMLTATKPPVALRDAIVSAVRSTPQLPAATVVNPPVPQLRLPSHDG